MTKELEELEHDNEKVSEMVDEENKNKHDKTLVNIIYTIYMIK